MPATLFNVDTDMVHTCDAEVLLHGALSGGCQCYPCPVFPASFHRLHLSQPEFGMLGGWTLDHMWTLSKWNKKGLSDFQQGGETKEECPKDAQKLRPLVNPSTICHGTLASSCRGTVLTLYQDFCECIWIISGFSFFHSFSFFFLR